MGGPLVALGALIGALGGLSGVVAGPRTVPAQRPSLLEVAGIVVLCTWAGMFLIGMLILPAALRILGFDV